MNSQDNKEKNINEEERIKNILAETLRVTFKEVLRTETHDLDAKMSELISEVSKIGALEKRVKELEKLITLNSLNLN